MTSASNETELSQGSQNEQGGVTEGGQREDEKQPDIHEKLASIEKQLKKLEDDGVKNPEEISEDRKKLEGEFSAKLAELKGKIGEENISDESISQIHAHLVEEVVVFEQQVAEHHRRLLEQKDKLVRVGEIAEASSTVGEFENAVKSAATKEGASNEVELAAKNLEAFSVVQAEHRGYGVKKGLQTDEGKEAAGVTEVNRGGGGDVIINAGTLAGVVAKEGAEFAHEVIKHEEKHTTQRTLKESPDGTVVVDPRNPDNKITLAQLHEGGVETEMAEKFRGGQLRPDAEGDPDQEAYVKGFDIFKTFKGANINAYIQANGEHAGDRVGLQFALAKDAGLMNDPDDKKFREIAEKAGFDDEETKRLLQMAGFGKNEDDLKLTA